MKAQRMFTATATATAVVLLGACASTPNPGNDKNRAMRHSLVEASIADFKTQDPSIQSLFDSAEGYVVFPRVITGALVVGGAYGKGEVYQKHKLIGYADISQGSIGAQIGGQKYGEIIFFQNEGSIVDFKYGTLEFDARATAIAASKGAATTADYGRGVIIFTLPESGLMAQAAVGGQKFRFEPIEK